MGYADLEAFGDSEIPTPHLDRLAAEGTKFTTAYTVVPICVPSRMGIMSGKFAVRFGVFNHRTKAKMSKNGIFHSKTRGPLTALMIDSAC